MNTTERKFVTQENITTETKSNSFKTFLGINSTFYEFRSSLLTKELIVRK